MSGLSLNKCKGPRLSQVTHKQNNSPGKKTPRAAGKVLQHHVAAVSKGSKAKGKEAESTGLISETQSNTGSRMIFASL